MGKTKITTKEISGKMINAEIIVIGDELLIGQVVDTNSGMIARRLNKIGISVSRTTTIADDRQAIKSALSESFSRSSIVLMTGGLGPTKDDITKQTLCEFFNTSLTPSAEVERHVRQLYQSRPDVLNRLTTTQWLVPKDCTVLTNRIGSAPIMAFSRKEIGKPSKWLYSMPGVPAEAEIAMDEQIIAHIQQHFSGDQVKHRTLIVSGIPESALAIHIQDWEQALPDTLHLAYLPKNRMIRLRLTGKGTTDTNLNELIDEQFNQLKDLVAPWLIADSDLPIQVLVGNKLKAKHSTVSSAESCTGGRIAAMLNSEAGSSAFYWGSIVAYDNSAKENLLGVKHETLTTYGAVSEQTVIQMAEGARRLLSTDYAVSTSGIAGPDGGSKEKPVGTVWVAVATPKKTVAQCLNLRGTREQIANTASNLALLMLLQNIE